MKDIINKEAKSVEKRMTELYEMLEVAKESGNLDQIKSILADVNNLMLELEIED